MATAQSRGLAAQLWCDPRVSDRVMDPELAEVIAEKIDRYMDTLIWVTGSADFGEGGKARKGWLKLGQPLLDEWTALDDLAADVRQTKTD